MSSTNVEWRNQQSSMAYRRLGRTGLMVSEILCGGNQLRRDNYRHVELAIDLGLNYLDMAPLYGDGESERAYGKLLAGSSRRGRVFLNTKISGLKELRYNLYKQVFDGLPTGKQEALLKRARFLCQERGVQDPGYHLDYFDNQAWAFEPSYLAGAMLPDYRHRVEGSSAVRKFILQSLDESLRRVGTEHFDLIMCPHGACSPEETQIPEIFETFAELKQQGKVRFLGVSAHNDPAGILRAAAETGQYDVVMMAYNVVNGGYLEQAIRAAAAKDVGLIAMKTARVVETDKPSFLPIPEWRIQKLNRIIPGPLKPPLKAYLWALQNQRISACVSDMRNETHVRENLSLAGRKAKLEPV